VQPTAAAAAAAAAATAAAAAAATAADLLRSGVSPGQPQAFVPSFEDPAIS